MVIDKLLAKVIGTQNERELKRLAPIVVAINAKEAAVQQLSDEQLRAKTAGIPERGSNRASRSTICCPTPLPWSARPAAAR